MAGLRCEIHIPISPTPDYLCRVHYLAASIERYSGLRPGEYRIVVTVGDVATFDLEERCPWSREYPLEWRWRDVEEFKLKSYASTALGRYHYEFQAPVVIMLDGDTLVTGSLTEVIDAAEARPRLFQAVPGYVSPFALYPAHLETASPREWWERIFAVAGLEVPPFDMALPGWPLMRDRPLRYIDQMEFSPPYPNAGFVVASPESIHQMGATLEADYALVRTVTDTILSGQIAMTLGIFRHGMEWQALPIRYNYHNTPGLEEHYPEEAAQIRVLHYMVPAQIDRVRDFQSYAHVEALFTRSGLIPANQFLVDRLRELHGGLRGA